MPKTVHVSTVHRCSDPRIVHKELKSLTASGWETHFVTTDSSARDEGGILFHIVRKSRNRLRRVFIDGWQAFRLAAALDPDIIHFHDPELLLWIPMLSRHCRAKLVFDIHEFYIQSISGKRWLPEVLKGLAPAVAKWVESRAFRRLAGLVVVSERMADEYTGFTGPIAIVPNYPIAAYYRNRPVDPAILARYAGKHVVTYVGGLARNRGSDLLLDVFAEVRQHVPDAFLLMIGKSASAEYESELKNHAASLLPPESYEFAGYIPTDKVFSYLRASSVGAYLPLRNEERYNWGEPTKYFEYCAAGLPVVMKSSEAKRRICARTGNGILVESDDAAEISKAVVIFLSDPALAKRHGENGKRAFDEHYSWEAVSSKINDLYQRVLGSVDL
jgi:glycosyltransferase involved in cell wall biosynthesis